MRLAVFGIGTPHGDDAAGPAVVARLCAEGLPVDVRADASGDPLALVDALADARGLVLIDATRSGLPAGTVHEPPLARIAGSRPASSHGLGVREALDLADALDRTPARLAVVAIEAATSEGETLSAPVHAALAEAVRRVRAHCDAWRAQDAEEPARA